MKTVSILYQNSADLRQRILDEKIEATLSCLVRIYVSDMTQPEALELACEIQRLIPHAKIAGCSASGIIYRGVQYPNGNLIMIDLCEEAQIYIGTFVWQGKTAQAVAEEAAAQLAGKPARFAHLFCGDHYYDVHNFVQELNARNGKIKLAGGVAGDILPKDIYGFVFTPQGVVENGLVIAALYGEKLYAYCGISTSHEPISSKHRLTDCVDSCWRSINGQDTHEWLSEQLGVQTLREYNETDWEGIAENDVLVRFPMVLEGHNGASRFLRYDSSIHGIAQYFSQVPLNTEFRIGYVSPSECVKESFKICNEIMEQPVETLFCYSCLFRRLYLNNCAEWEISPYQGYDLCGAFMMGEIGNLAGVNEFLNGACCIVGLSENKTYIRPDISVFEQLHKIEDDNKDLLNLALKKQSENMSKYNEQLLARLISQQKTSKEQLYIDFNTGIGNYLKYKEDKKLHPFNKICMVKIENSDLIITHLGHETYTDIIRRAAQQVSNSIHEMSESNLLFRYMFNENSFYMVADDRLSANHFLEISRRLFNKYRFIKLSDTDDVLVNRFVVVLDQDELIEIALNAFQANKNIQVPFLICEKDAASSFSTAEEFKMIGVLNRALENDGVVPYFQGIYDNKLHLISKYEALMRIVDLDGTVYVPAQFMDIAKKYHLYSHLSNQMMRKVFTLFQGKPYTVTLNFSVYDINTPEMQKIIFDALDQIGDASNFVLEILEDEEFRDISILKDFIFRVRKYGVRIAIDDFGTGYSNLLEIANISPDFIKVDGAIIRNLHKSEVNRKLLDIIVYIGKHFGTEIVAEFVENEEIQRQIAQVEIRYSQGYYFSYPKPYEETFAHNTNELCGAGSIN